MYTAIIEIIESPHNLKIKILEMWLKPKRPENAEKTLTKLQNRKKDPEGESIYFFSLGSCQETKRYVNRFQNLNSNFLFMARSFDYSAVNINREIQLCTRPEPVFPPVSHEKKIYTTCSLCLTFGRMRSTGRTNFKWRLRNTILFHSFFLFGMSNENNVAYHKVFILLAPHDRFETSRGEVCWESGTNSTHQSVLNVDPLQSSRSPALLARLKD